MRTGVWNLFLVLVLSSTVVALARPRIDSTVTSQAPTITTLPPAQPSGPDTASCDFTDRDQLLERVVDDWKEYNVSLLVETCPGVCTLIYGDGNPDVSGIGVLISYIVQFILTLFIGPGLYYLFLFDNHFSESFNRFLKKVRDDVVSDVNSGNNWLTLSIMTASAVRLAQYPPIFEIDFIFALLWLQGLLVLARAVALFAVANQTNPKETNAVIFDASFTGFTTIFAEIVILTLIPAKPGDGPAQYKAMVAISEYCISERDLPIPAPKDPAPKDDSSLPWWWGIVSILMGLAALGIMLCLMYWFMIAFDSGWEKLPTRWQRRLEILGTRIWNAGVLFLKLLPGMIWFALCIWLLVILEGYRNDLKRTFGQQYQDSYWGFGQVAIMVMLLQPLSAFGKLIPLRKEKEKTKSEETQPLLRDDSAGNRQDTEENEQNESA